MFRGPGLDSCGSLLRSAALYVVAVLLLATCAMPLAAQGDGESRSQLRFVNEDVLDGTLLGIDEQGVQWRSPLFATPITVDRRVLTGARVELAPPPLAEGLSGVVLTSGTVLPGQLLDITDRHVRIESPQFGACALERSYVYAILFDEPPVSSAPRSPQMRFWYREGGPVVASLVSYDPKARRFVLRGEGGEQVSVDQRRLRRIDLPSMGVATDLSEHVRLRYSDGTVIRGTSPRWKGDGVELQVLFQDRPLRFGWRGLHTVEFPTAASRPGSAPAVLQLSDQRLRGTPGDGDLFGTVHWRPVGSPRAYPLVATTWERMLREPAPVPTHGTTDLLCLGSGELHACEIREADGERFVAGTPYSEPAEVDRSDVSVAVFSAARRAPIDGFSDPGWKVQPEPEKLDLTRERVVFTENGSLAHPRALWDGSLEFDLEWESDSQIQIQLTVDGSRGFTPHWTLLMMQERLFVHAAGAGGNGFRHMGDASEDRPTSIGVAITDTGIEFLIDGKNAITTPIPAGSICGEGLSMQVHVHGRRKNQGGSDHELTLSNLRTRESRRSFRFPRIDKTARDVVLTVPRFRKKSPATHVVVAGNGDLLRGRLQRIDEHRVTITSRLEPVTIDRDDVAGVVCLAPPPTATDEAAPGGAPPAEPPALPDDARVLRVFLRDGSRYQLQEARLENSEILGMSATLGAVRLPTAEVMELESGVVADLEPWDVPMAWQSIPATEPRFAAPTSQPSRAGFGTASPLLGTDVSDLTLTFLDGRTDEVGAHAGKVIVLDFWSTWCVPCVRGLPQLLAATDAFDPERVAFVAVNQQENKATIRAFLAAQGWQRMAVALDREGAIGQRFQVSAIPQTVIIDPDGKVVAVHVGGHADLEAEVKRVIQELLERRGD